MNKQQYNYMLQNDISGMDALDEPIKRAEQDIDDLKMEMYGVMGAFVGSQWGSQQKNNAHATLPDASSDSYLRGMQHAYGNMGDGLAAEQVRKQAGKQKGMLHAYGNVGDGIVAEQARKEAAAQKGMLHAYGNVGEGLVAEQVRKDKNAAYEGMLHAYGNIGDGIVAEQVRNSNGKSSEILRLQKILEGIWYANQNGTINEFMIKSGLDQKAILEIPDKLEFLMGPLEYQKFIIENSVNNMMQNDELSVPPSFFNYQKGNATIEDREIPIAIGRYNYEDISQDAISSIDISFDKREFWEMISQLSTVGEKDASKTIKYNSGQTATASAAAILSAAQNMVDTKRHFDIRINIVESEGKEVMLIEYTDSYLDLDKIFGVGESTMSKEQANNDSGDDLYYLLDGDYQNIDEKHLYKSTTGYLYVQEGKMMVKPIFFLNDKIVRDGRNITTSFFQPFYLDKNAVVLIDKKLKENGININVDLNMYE